MSVYTKELAESVHGYIGGHYLTWDGELDYILSYAEKTGGPVLELACGAGRMMMQLARYGYNVCGIDASAPMLEIGTKAVKNLDPGIGRKIRFIQGDMRCFSFRKKFPLIIIPFLSFWLNLRDEDDAFKCLSCITENLTDEGVFLIDGPGNTATGWRGDWWQKTATELGFSFTTELYFMRNEDKEYTSKKNRPEMLIGRKNIKI